MKPFSPTDLDNTISKTIPDFVIEAVNNLLVRQGICNYYRINGRQLKAEIAILNVDKIPPAGWWYSFEDIYRKLGWIVKFNDEDTFDDSYYEFKRK